VAALLVHARNGLFMNWSGKQAGEGIEFFLVALAVAAALVLSAEAPSRSTARWRGPGADTGTPRPRGALG